MSRINWDKWDLTFWPRSRRVFIAHVKRRSEDGTMIEADDVKEVTHKFYGILVEILRAHGGVIEFETRGGHKYRIRLETIPIEDKVKKIRELAEEIIDNEYSAADEELAEEIIDLVDEILKLKERDGRGEGTCG